jgi:hypothetical protein
MDRLFVAVMGQRNSGKSTTWNTLFGQTVRTGKNQRKLSTYNNKSVDVFLVSGSFEERNEYAGDILQNQTCRIVLCSVQYIAHAKKTFDYAKSINFELYVQWLNQGYSDTVQYRDNLGFIPYLLNEGAHLCQRDGKLDPYSRTEEIRQFIHGWAEARNLTY